MMKCRMCQTFYFKKVEINTYEDYGGNLYSLLPEGSPASDIRAYECLKCKAINLPTLDFSSPESERKLAKAIIDLSDGKDVKFEPKKMRQPGPTPGYFG